MLYFRATIVYNCSTKGSGNMTAFEKIDLIVQKNTGIVSTAQVINSGISKMVFYKYVKEKSLRQVSHGIYVSEDAWTDDLYVLHLRCPEAVFSHETALFLHDLTDREPLQFSLTVKRGYNTSRLKADGVKAYTVKEDLTTLGKITLKTAFGRDVPIYDMERTICDLVRYRNNVEIQTLQSALKAYAKRKDKDLRKLINYANAFHIESTVRQYMEVLI